MNFIYSGRRDENGKAIVTVTTPLGIVYPLPRRGDLAHRSPAGFGWGDSGRQPAQLAVSLLAHALRDDDLALALHVQFKRRNIAILPANAPWSMTSDQVKRAAAEMQRRPAGVAA